MSAWIDRVQAHPLWQQLEALGPAIDQAIERVGIDAEALDSLHRLKVVLSFIGQRLAGADPYLITAGNILDHIFTNTQNSTNEVQNFIDNGSPSHLQSANNYVDLALNSLALINVPLVSTDLQALRQASDSYRVSLDDNLQALQTTLVQSRTDFETLNEKISDLSTEVTSEKQRLSTLASEHQSQFSASQESRNQQNAEAQASRMENFNELLLDYNKALTEQNTESNKQRETLLGEQRQALTELNEDYRDKGLGLLEEMEAHKAQVEKLVGIIGNLGVTSGFQKTANQARWYVATWQIVTVSTLAFTVWLAFSEVLPLLKNDFSWEGLTVRLVLFVPLGVLVAYAISQADKYQEIERKSRRLALELEALGPFIASLPIESQHQFRLKIGDRSFGATVDLVDGPTVRSPATALDIVGRESKVMELMETLADAFKKWKS